MARIYSLLSIRYAHRVLVADALAHGLVGGWVLPKG